VGTFVNSFLLVYAALFPIINPVGGAPIFLGLTQSSSSEHRTLLARQVARNSFLLLLGSVLIGSHVLGFFGISQAVLRIGGGFVVAAFGWKLLNSEAPEGHQEAAAAPRADSFYPLTMPLTVGPGSISVAVTLGSQRPSVFEPMSLLVAASAGILGLLAVCATVYLCYRYADRLVQFLGTGGSNVVLRLSAFILICIGIQIAWGGWSELSAPPHA
jgi:multiple antibiotic resistance protein